jgi:hypothetical protein
MNTDDVDKYVAVDNSDFSIWEIDANNFVTGCVASYMDGNGAVDNAHFSIWETNANEFIRVQKP